MKSRQFRSHRIVDNERSRQCYIFTIKADYITSWRGLLFIIMRKAVESLITVIFNSFHAIFIIIGIIYYYNYEALMKIAVDFDGTVVTHQYPNIGKEIPFAITTLKMLQMEQHQIILWSVREGKLLEEAVDYCKQRGLEFYAVNASYPGETTQSTHYSRKIKADMFIDDINIGGLPDWGQIYEMIHGNMNIQQLLVKSNQVATKKKKGIWPF